MAIDTTAIEYSADERIRTAALLLLSVRRVPQAELAVALDLNQQKISHRMRGRSRFTIDEVDKLARFFDVPVGVLFAGPGAVLRFLADATDPDLIVLIAA